MSLLRPRTFRGRIFLAVFVVGLVPAAAALAGGAWVLQNIGTRSGTLGPWDAVAETGQELLEAVDTSSTADPALRQAASRHREALSGSVRMSRLYSYFAERVVRVLPLLALFAGLLAGVVAFFTARRLARGFGEPVAELAGWTEHIAHGDPLPPESESEATADELSTLRTALRSMAAQIEDGRLRAVETARMRSWTKLARRMAHEIKNPLTPMRMAALTLARRSESAEAEASQILLAEIERLDEMARTFSQYGRLPEGPRSLVDLSELMTSLASQHATDRISVRVVSEPGVAVHVDGHFDALERAFRNLVLNAVEAQEVPGGEVEVSVSAEEDQAVVRIRDRGPGVPEELLHEIWNPDVTTKSRGTGLGLALVRQTVLHHQGQVAVESRPGGGATFEIRLPAARPTPASDTPSASSP